jgi:hypothetical protein
MHQLKAASYRALSRVSNYGSLIAGIALTAILFVLIIAGTGCSSPASRSVSDSPVIAMSTVVEHPVVYPLGNTSIRCVASSALNSKLSYKWVSNDGKIIGEGAEIKWEAPAAYGDYHIMVTVDDGNGNTVNKIATVSVIVREPGSNPDCASCPK